MMVTLIIQCLYLKLKLMVKMAKDHFGPSKTLAAEKKADQKSDEKADTPEQSQKVRTQPVETSTDVGEAMLEMLLKFKKDELIILCRSRGLMVSGVKLDLAKRLIKWKR